MRQVAIISWLTFSLLLGGLQAIAGWLYIQQAQTMGYSRESPIKPMPATISLSIEPLMSGQSAILALHARYDGSIADKPIDLGYRDETEARWLVANGTVTVRPVQDNQVFQLPLIRVPDKPGQSVELVLSVAQGDAQLSKSRFSIQLPFTSIPVKPHFIDVSVKPPSMAGDRFLTIQATFRSSIPQAAIVMDYKQESPSTLVSDGSLTLQPVFEKQHFRIPITTSPASGAELSLLLSVPDTAQLFPGRRFIVVLPSHSPPPNPDSWEKTVGPRLVVIDTNRLQDELQISRALERLAMDTGPRIAVFVMQKPGQLVRWTNGIILGGDAAFKEDQFEEAFNMLNQRLAENSDPNHVVILWSNGYPPIGAAIPIPKSVRNNIDLLWLNAPKREFPAVDRWLEGFGDVTKIFDANVVEPKVRETLKRQR